MLIDITSDDAGLYICSVLQNTSDSDSEPYQMQYREYVHAHVRVRTKPGEIYFIHVYLFTTPLNFI